MEEEIISVGDYVEPKFDYYEKSTSDYYNQEDLYGYVLEKHGDLITIEGIGSKKESTWKQDMFKKAEVPEIFKNKSMVRKIVK